MKSQHPGPLSSALRCLPLTAAMLICSCSESEPTPQTRLSVASSFDALSRALDDCELAKRACRDATNCEEAELEACEAEHRACREAARPAREAMREAARACRDTYDTCKAAAGDDESAREQCREERELCMDATRPPKPPCRAALDACLDDARNAEPVPGEQGGEADAGVADPACRPGHKRPHMRSEAEEACHAQAHACLEAEKAAMPPLQPPKCGPAPRPRPDAGVEPPPPAAGAAAPGPGPGPGERGPDRHAHCRGGRKLPPSAAGSESPAPPP